jgi:hypothetical protein
MTSLSFSGEISEIQWGLTGTLKNSKELKGWEGKSLGEWKSLVCACIWSFPPVYGVKGQGMDVVNKVKKRCMGSRSMARQGELN